MLSISDMQRRQVRYYGDSRWLLELHKRQAAMFHHQNHKTRSSKCESGTSLDCRCLARRDESDRVMTNRAHSKRMKRTDCSLDKALSS